MTTTCGSRATPGQFPPENATSPRAGVPQGRPALGALGRAAGRTPFATCLELLGAERRTGRVAFPANPPANPPDTPADTARDARPSADDRGDRGFSASDAVPVGGDATIDPMVSILFSLAPRAAPASAQVGAAPPAPPDPRTPMEQLMTKLVRRVAWSGNARTGSARLELGAGALEGATLTIHADDGVVRVALDTPPGVDQAAWRERIAGRLAARGLHVETVEVL